MFRPVQATMHAHQKSLDNDDAIQRPNTAHASCYGCGTSLQLSDPDYPGYVERQKFEIKQQHKQLDQLLCSRCQALSNGAMIPAVADFPQQQNLAHDTTDSSPIMRTTGFQHKKSLVTPDELRKELQTVRNTRALIVLLIDLLDASGSILSKVRDLVGSNPIIVIGTKVDLLPERTDLARVTEWLHELLAFKRISVSSVHLASSKTGSGIAPAVAAVRRERLGRDVYVMGAANVGKSAFIRALVKEMASMKSRQFDPSAIQKSKRLPVESAMPGTTLKLIPLEVFSSGGVLYDTPGLHIHHRMPHLLTPEENKEFNLRKKLNGYAVSLHNDVNDDGANGVLRAYYSWGNVAHVEIKACPEGTQLVFYGPPILRVVEKKSTAGEEQMASIPVDAKQVQHQCFGEGSIQARGGLRKARTVVLDIPKRKSSHYSDTEMVSLCDIAVSGVPGWISVQTTAKSSSFSSSAYDTYDHRNRSIRNHTSENANTIHASEAIVMDMYAPVGVEVFVRPSMPVGDTICMHD